MKNTKVILSIILIIVLIGIIVSFVLIKSNNKNTNIEKQETAKEQLTKTSNDNAYVSMATHLSKLNEKQQELDNIKNTVGQKYYIQVHTTSSSTASVKITGKIYLYINGVEVAYKTGTGSWGWTNSVGIDIGKDSDYPLEIGEIYTISAKGTTSGSAETNITTTQTLSIIVNGKTVATNTKSGSWCSTNVTTSYELTAE